jgi:hypothetical protein
MRTLGIGLAMAIVFLVGCAVGGSASRFVVPPAQAQNAQRWDYFCFEEYRAEDIMRKAKKAGADGWEMVLADGMGSFPTICFKRPL